MMHTHTEDVSVLVCVCVFVCMYVQKSDRLPMKVPGCASNMRSEGGKGALGKQDGAISLKVFGFRCK